jgi:outer membrane immunogenic protein
MRKLVFVAALVASSALSAPAFAQDAAPGGFRVGVVGGLDIVRPGDSEDSRIRGDDQSIEGSSTASRRAMISRSAAWCSASKAN